jgi:hypothetical protein
MVSTANNRYLRIEVDSTFRDAVFAEGDADKSTLEVKLTAGAFKDSAEANCNAIAYTDNIRCHVISTTFNNMYYHEPLISNEKTFYLPKDISIDCTSAQYNGGFNLIGYDESTKLVNCSFSNNNAVISSTVAVQTDDFEGGYTGGLNDNWTQLNASGTPTEETTIVRSGTSSQEIANIVATEGLHFDTAKNLALNAKYNAEIYVKIPALDENNPTDNSFESWTGADLDDWTETDSGGADPLVISENVDPAFVANGTSSVKFVRTFSNAVTRTYALTSASGMTFDSGKKYNISFYSYNAVLFAGTQTISVYLKNSSTASLQLIATKSGSHTFGVTNASFTANGAGYDQIEILFSSAYSSGIAGATSTFYFDYLRIYKLVDLDVTFGSITSQFAFTNLTTDWVRCYVAGTCSSAETAQKFEITVNSNSHGVSAIYFDDYNFYEENLAEKQFIKIENATFEATSITFALNYEAGYFNFENCRFAGVITVPSNAGGTKYIVCDKCFYNGTGNFFSSNVSDVYYRLANSYIKATNLTAIGTRTISAYSNVDSAGNSASGNITAYNCYNLVTTNADIDNTNRGGLTGITLAESQTGTAYVTGGLLKVGREFSDFLTEMVTGVPQGGISAVSAFQNAPTQQITVSTAVLDADGKTVTLTLSENLVTGSVYAVQINNVESTSGDVIAKGTTEYFVSA